jgi:hypothetical protein
MKKYYYPWFFSLKEIQFTKDNKAIKISKLVSSHVEKSRRDDIIIAINDFADEPRRGESIITSIQINIFHHVQFQISEAIQDTLP